jgi:hypothetical protein
MPTFTVQNQNFNAQVRQFGPFNVPKKATAAGAIAVQITSSDWSANPGRRLHILLEQSDDGVDFRTWSEDFFETGQFSAKNPTALPSYSIRVDDGTGNSPPKTARVFVDAPDGVVNAGAVITF